MKRLFLYILIGLIIFSLLPGCGPKTTKIRVATTAIWAPFESVNEKTGEIEGFDIDLFKAIAEKEDLDVEFVNIAWDPLLAGMTQCLYDAAISSITITEKRKKDMLFSDPYFNAGQIVTVRKENTDITGKDALAGKVVGAQFGTTGSFAVEKMKNVTLKTYDEIAWAYEDLMNGKIDAVVADNPFAIAYVGEHANKLKTMGDVFTDEMYGIAVCKTKPDLLVKINSGLKAVEEEGVIDRLVEKWLSRQ